MRPIHEDCSLISVQFAIQTPLPIILQRSNKITNRLKQTIMQQFGSGELHKLGTYAKELGRVYRNEKQFNNFISSLKRRSNSFEKAHQGPKGQFYSFFERTTATSFHPVERVKRELLLQSRIGASKKRNYSRKQKIQQNMLQICRKMAKPQEIEQIQPVRKQSNGNKELSTFIANKEQSTRALNNQQEIIKRANQITGIENRKISQKTIPSIAWNPQKMQFSYLQKQNEGFLLDLLGVNEQKVIDFILETQQLERLEKPAPSIFSKEIDSQSILHFFLTMLELLQIKPLNEPLIKRYNNCIYYGEKPQDGHLFHSGILVYKGTGNTFLGQFHNFQKHGQGVQITGEDSLEKDRNSALGLMNAETKQRSKIIYKGSFFKNTKTGTFLVISPQRYVYHGQLVKGRFSGSGVLITQDYSFEGSWLKSFKLEGIQHSNQTKSSYEGSFKNNFFEGEGKLKQNNCLYEGEFHAGLKHGLGILVTESYIYQGEFQKGKKQGQGILLEKIKGDAFKSQNPEQGQKSRQAFCNQDAIRVKCKNDKFYLDDSIKTPGLFENKGDNGVDRALNESLSSLQNKSQITNLVTLREEADANLSSPLDTLTSKTGRQRNNQPSCFLKTMKADSIPKQFTEIQQIITSEAQRTDDYKLSEDDSEDRVDIKRRQAIKEHQNSYLNGNSCIPGLKSTRFRSKVISKPWRQNY